MPAGIAGYRVPEKPLLQLLKRMFLGAFAKLRKATLSFVSVRPPAWNRSVPTGWIFVKFDISVFLEKLEKIQVLLKSDENDMYFT
jgi:hypothetical protein